MPIMVSRVVPDGAVSQQLIAFLKSSSPIKNPPCIIHGDFQPEL